MLPALDGDAAEVPRQLDAMTRRLLLWAGAAALVVASLLTPTAGAQTGSPADVERARQAFEAQQAEVARLRAEATEAEGVHQAAQTELARVEGEIAAAEARLAALAAEIASLTGQVQNQAVAAYVAGNSYATELFDLSTELSDRTKVVYLGTLATNDQSAIERLDVLVSDEERLRGGLEQLRAEQQTHVDAANAAAQQALDLLAEAQRLEDDLEVRYQAEVAEQRRREEEERRRREAELARQREAARRAQEQARLQAQAQNRVVTAPASGGSTSGIRLSVCPVPGSAFVDSWGAPRSGGRGHRGTDLMAGRGTPNLAVVSGSVSFTGGGLGGTAVWLSGDDGVRYYYAHLQETVGSQGRVSAGTVVGLTGSTGNAAGGAPHTHFEVHPGGGAAVNPYPVLRASGC
jgi:murein DD-endopeptidase MepM/ murein hydrolase activator NlpD